MRQQSYSASRSGSAIRGTVIATIEFSEGRLAAALERELHKFQSSYGIPIDKRIMPQGFTETLPVSAIDDIMAILTKYTDKGTLNVFTS